VRSGSFNFFAIRSLGCCTREAALERCPPTHVRSHFLAMRKSDLMRVNSHPEKVSTMHLRNNFHAPIADAVDHSSTGVAGAPLVPFDEPPPTSLELLRQLESLVRELFDISLGT
jgi:hypothetical protein